MLTHVHYRSQKFIIDLSKPLDISIPMKASINNVNAWYLKEPIIEPVVIDNKTYTVADGASINFNNIKFQLILKE